MALHMDKITSYYDKDPRYGFVIKDSDEYNTPISPFPIKHKCKIHKKSYDPTLRAGCDSQRYEHCIQDPFNDKYISCNISLEDLSNKTSVLGDRQFIPKTLNNNTFYSDTRISKLNNPTLTIDYSPDTIKKSNKIDRSNIEKLDDKSQILEHCVALGIVKGGTCGKCGPICCPCIPSWLPPEDSCLICLCLCIMCICLPCIISCIGIGTR
jgi:hypothetical protein